MERCIRQVSEYSYHFIALGKSHETSPTNALIPVSNLLDDSEIFLRP